MNQLDFSLTPPEGVKTSAPVRRVRPIRPVHPARPSRPFRPCRAVAAAPPGAAMAGRLLILLLCAALPAELRGQGGGKAAPFPCFREGGVSLPHSLRGEPGAAG